MFNIENLSFKYPRNKEYTLRDISFKINEGEVFGLLGPSGVGKSTTQKILIKLLDKYDGKVIYKKKNLKSYGKSFYQQIGVGFEMPVHFSKLTAKENLEFFARLYDSRADIYAIMKRVGLEKDMNKKVSEFSKGMKVRLNFVRALLNNPKMLFLDEPTSGLDPKNSKIVKDIIKEYRQKGGTVILTTHLMNDVDELCDRVAFMAAGKISTIDTPKNLKLKNGMREVDVEYADKDSTSKKTFALDSLGENREFLQLIKERQIITMHSKETTLDDIFIKLTGVQTDE